MDWIFLIDTNKYSGNFERPMCAYVCGHIGDCEVGEEEMKIYLKEKKTPLANVLQKPDEHGCYRPCAIWPTPGWSNDGMGGHKKLKKGESMGFPAYQSVAIFFEQKPTANQLKILMERAHAFKQYLKKTKGYYRQAVNILGFRLITEEIVHTEVWKHGDVA